MHQRPQLLPPLMAWRSMQAPSPCSPPSVPGQLSTHPTLAATATMTRLAALAASLEAAPNLHTAPGPPPVPSMQPRPLATRGTHSRGGAMRRWWLRARMRACKRRAVVARQAATVCEPPPHKYACTSPSFPVLCTCRLHSWMPFAACVPLPLNQSCCLACSLHRQDKISTWQL